MAVAKYNDPDVRATIVQAVRDGVPLRQVGPLAGIHGDTLWNWKALAKHQPEAHPELVEMFEQIESARAEAVGERVSRISAAGAGGAWQADAWWLERQVPEEFARREKVELEGERTPAIQINAIIVKDPEALEHSRGILSHLTAGRAAITERSSARDEPATE